MSAGQKQVPRLLKVREVVEITGLQRWRVYELVRNGEMPAMHIGRTLRFSEAALAEWIEQEHAASVEGDGEGVVDE